MMTVASDTSCKVLQGDLVLSTLGLQADSDGGDARCSGVGQNR